jgi:hypothetical protein
MYDPNKHCRSVVFVSVTKDNVSGSSHKGKYKECVLLHWDNEYYLIQKSKLDTLVKLPVEIHKQLIQAECNFSSKNIKSIVNWCVANSILIKEELRYQIKEGE